jgi:hypothetical protein
MLLRAFQFNIFLLNSLQTFIKGDTPVTKLSFRTYALFLSIILWAVLLGGIVYSHIVFFPVYMSDLPNSAILVNGKYALNEARFWMLLHPMLILSLIATLALNWKIKVRRTLILTSFGVYIAVIIVSSLYFIPELIEFAKSPESNVPAAEWLARGNRWQYLSWIRGTICFIFFVPLLIALTKPETAKESVEMA